MEALQDSLKKQSFMINDILFKPKEPTYSGFLGSPNNHNDPQLSLSIFKNTRLRTFLPISEHELFLSNLKMKQEKSMNSLKSQQTQSPKFDLFMSKLKVISPSKKILHNNIISSSDEEDQRITNIYCQQCKNVQVQQKDEQHKKQEKTQSQLHQLSNLVGQSLSLKTIFQTKFGTIDKIERLWSDGKHIKLLNKLVKVMSTIFKRLISVQVDDLLLTNLSNEQSELERFKTPQQPQQQQEKDQVRQSPRFHEDETAQLFYFAQKVQQPQKSNGYNQPPSLTRKFVSQEIKEAELKNNNQNERSSSDMYGLLQSDQKSNSTQKMKKRIDFANSKIRNSSITKKQQNTTIERRSQGNMQHSPPRVRTYKS